MSHLASYMVKHLTHTGDRNLLKTHADAQRVVKAMKLGQRIERDGRKVTASEKGVLMQIADDHNEDRGCAWPSIPNLAERAGLSPQQCRRLVHGLEEVGLLELRPRLRDRDEGRSSNEYRFWFDPPFDRASSRETERKLRLQALRAAQRPKQMDLTPLPSMAGAPLPPAAVPPFHGREGPPPTGDSVPLSSTAVPPLPSAVGQELVLELPGEPPAELPSDSTPLPPVTGGAGGPILPTENVTFDDPGFGMGSGIAARWVMEQLGLGKRRMEAMLTASLRWYCQQRRGVSLQEAALTAVQRWREYLADVELMRFGPWSPQTFFGDNHWTNPQAWPYDREKVQRRREASVGTWRPP